MKKWFLLVSLLVILSVMVIYAILPSNLQVTNVVMLACSPASAARGLLQDFNWSKWLNPDSEKSVTSGIRPEEFSYSVSSRLNRELQIDILKGNQKWLSRLYIVPGIADSISLKWQCILEPGMNPIRRWKQYRIARALQQDMHKVLVRLKSLLENPQNIYGFQILRTRVTDTLLIATRASFKSNPSASQIYKMIDELSEYIKKQGATETGYPMVHHDQFDSLHTETMVAIPVNKELPDAGKFSHKRMVRGYILVSDVKGGPATIRNAFNEMENYISDNQKQKIAISFESLVTNRIKTPDSSSWITRVYFPIVQ